MSKLPVITVTCVRDLDLLDLQAQSIYNYLDHDCPVYIVVNEEDPGYWNEYFNNNLKQYYKNHELTVLYRSDFNGEWHYWLPSKINPWAIGWETQQILKLAIATKIPYTGYLILDSQNFLIKSWSSNYNLPDNKIPYRTGMFVMPMVIWDDYSTSLELAPCEPSKETMSMSTPIFMHTGLVKELIESKGGISDFSLWFKSASRIKSEFILYLLWATKNNALSELHERVADWGNPMLRDSPTFDKDFNEFIDRIGVVPSQAWISANHRSWGDMSDQQYDRLKIKLADYRLVPHFDEYRSTYVDIKF